MKRVLALASVFAFLVCAGCGDSHESLAGEQVAAMKELSNTLDIVKDADSAKAAKPTLKKLVERMNDINARMTKLPAPTEAEVNAMGEKYGKQMDEISQKMVANMMRVQFDPAIQKELSDIDLKAK